MCFPLLSSGDFHEDIRDLEEKAAESLLRLGKIPVGWEEALFTTGVVRSCLSCVCQ